VDLNRLRVTVVLNSAVLILMLEYTFVFAGVKATTHDGPIVVGITLRVFSYIKISVVLR
jgi:translation initiation factor 2B subunit (eIF-2B alpha/beta/delta family)